MSIEDIKARFSKRIQTASQENQNGSNMPRGKNTPRISDADVGIVKYMNDLPGFHAIMKKRYSDFVVHEIDCKRNMVVLDSFEAPDETPQPAADVVADGFLSSEIIDQLNSLVEENSVLPSVEIEVTSRTKENRTEIHRYLKEKYGTRILANTFDKDNKKFISVSRCENGKRDNRWPAHLPNYLHFTMFKKNLETNHALNILAKKLNMKVDGFSTAGTKDKRAVTTQRMSVKNTRVSKLMSKPPKTWPSLVVGNCEYKGTSLALGALWGNNFEIALREVTASDEEIDKAMVALKENGFVNYYGRQRFGTSPENPTHDIGKLLIMEQYQAAVSRILRPRQDDMADLRRARQVWATSGSAKDAYKCLKYKRSVEAHLLRGLMVNGPRAFVNAFDAIPRNVRLLYIHSFQSYIWNKVVTKRLEKFGTAVLVGDLVNPKGFVEEDTEEAILGEETTEEMKQEIEDVKPENEKVEIKSENDKEEIKPVKDAPTKVTADNIGDFTIYDVLLPLPGTDSIYPDNETHQIYKDTLMEDQLTTDSFSSKSKKYNLTGAYRYIARQPHNLSWRTVRYSDPDQDLILSDEDRMQGNSLPNTEGDLKALVIKMDLEKSTYATMAIREVLHSETSVGYQARVTGKRAADAEGDAKSAKKAKEENGDDGDTMRPEDY